MAGGLFAYSGLVTKTKAMHGRLLSNEEIIRLSEAESVEEIIAFLRECGSYAPIYQSHEEIAHRAQVEAVINDSLYADYGRLYRFASGAQREGLSIVFLRYEINVLKDCLERVRRGGDGRQLSYLKLFFDRHADFDVAAVTSAGSFAELAQALEGTRYGAYFGEIQGQAASDADGGIGLDILYYRMAWEKKDKLSDGSMKKIYTKLLGTEIDWQNIMWMYRCKRFYGRGSAQISADMIPIRYRLKKAEFLALLDTDSPEEFVSILGRTAYFTEKDAVVKLGDEVTFGRIMEKTYQQMCQRYPMSLAPVLRYLYDKENEIDRLTSVLEGVRYRIPARQIQELVLATEA